MRIRKAMLGPKEIPHRGVPWGRRRGRKIRHSHDVRHYIIIDHDREADISQRGSQLCSAVDSVNATAYTHSRVCVAHSINSAIKLFALAHNKKANKSIKRLFDLLTWASSLKNVWMTERVISWTREGRILFDAWSKGYWPLWVRLMI